MQEQLEKLNKLLNTLESIKTDIELFNFNEFQNKINEKQDVNVLLDINDTLTDKNNLIATWGAIREEIANNEIILGARSYAQSSGNTEQINIALATIHSLLECLNGSLSDISCKVKKLQQQCEAKLSLLMDSNMPASSSAHTYPSSYMAAASSSLFSIDQQPGIINKISDKYLDGLHHFEVNDDGNCFYYAIAAALNANSEAGSSQYDHHQLRCMVADFFGDAESSDNPMTPKRRDQKESLSVMVVAQLQEKYDNEIADANQRLNLAKEFNTADVTRITEELQNLRNKEQQMTTVTPEKLKAYIEQTRTDKVFADNASVGALSERLNRPIVVMEFDHQNKPKSRMPIIGEDKQGNPIFVHFNGINHYNALIVQPGYDSKDILRELKKPRARSSVSLHFSGQQANNSASDRKRSRSPEDSAGYKKAHQ